MLMSDLDAIHRLYVGLGSGTGSINNICGSGLTIVPAKILPVCTPSHMVLNLENVVSVGPVWVLP